MYGNRRMFGGKNRNKNLTPKGLKVVYMPTIVKSLDGSLRCVNTCDMCVNLGGKYVDCGFGKSTICIQYGFKFGEGHILYHPVFKRI